MRSIGVDPRHPADNSIAAVDHHHLDDGRSVVLQCVGVAIGHEGGALLVADQVVVVVCHAFVETEDGRLLLPTGLLRTWEGKAPDGLGTLALVSGRGTHVAGGSIADVGRAGRGD